MVLGDSDTDEWNRIQQKSLNELKEILQELNIDFDDDEDEDDIRSLAFDESAMTLWLSKHPLELHKIKKEEKLRKEKDKELREFQDRIHGPRDKDYSHIVDPERKHLLEYIKKSGINLEGAESKPTEQLEQIASMIKSDELANLMKSDEPDDLELEERPDSEYFTTTQEL